VVLAEILPLAGAIDPLLPPDLALRPLLDVIARGSGSWRASLQALDPVSGHLRLVSAIGLSVSELREDSRPRPRSVSEWVLREARGVVLQGSASDERFTGSGDPALESTVSVPIEAAEGTIGVLSLARHAPSGPFSETDVAGLTAAVRPVGDAVLRAWRAQLAERSLAPRAEPGGPSGTLLRDGVTETIRHEIAVGRVSGPAPAFDACDRAPHADGSVTLIAADVPGRGPAAAHAAGFVRGQFAAAAAPGRSAAGIVAQIATAIAERFGPRGACALWVAHLGRNGEVAACSAGYPPAFWVPGSGGSAVLLGSGGPPAAAAMPPRYDEERFRMFPGDLLVCVSDGAHAAAAAAGQSLDTARLADWLEENRRLPLDRVAQGLLDHVLRPSSRAFPPDDVQVLVVRYRPED
jgi:hypothetical protein